jgi:NAD-dependent dihydropyrimidine dehydrogenase PreA subunit
MGIRKIDYQACTQCGACVDFCPMDVLRMDEKLKRPFIRYLRDCQACFLCETECPAGAIYVTPDRERRTVLPW